MWACTVTKVYTCGNYDGILRAKPEESIIQPIHLQKTILVATYYDATFNLDNESAMNSYNVLLCSWEIFTHPRVYEILEYIFYVQSKLKYKINRV